MKGYEKLDDVLSRAYNQASEGKGAERHANDLPFHEQPMQQVANQVGRGFLLGQAIKKLTEGQNLPPERAVAEWLGAINYIAGAVIHLEAHNDNKPKTPADIARKTYEYLDPITWKLHTVTGDQPIGSDWIAVPKGASVLVKFLENSSCNEDLYFYKDNGDKHIAVFNNGAFESTHWEMKDLLNLSYLKHNSEREILWSRHPLPLTRDQARKKLSMMTRDSIEIINDVAVEFDKYGYFCATVKLGCAKHCRITKSLNEILDHLFQEDK